jgi:hypothetical protein
MEVVVILKMYIEELKMKLGAGSEVPHGGFRGEIPVDFENL